MDSDKNTRRRRRRRKKIVPHNDPPPKQRVNSETENRKVAKSKFVNDQLKLQLEKLLNKSNEKEAENKEEISSE